MLVDHVHGRMLLRKKKKCFNDKHMRSMKDTWHSLLESMQQEWPFFYGALLATTVENIHTVSGGDKKVSGRKTDVELSLRWWTQDVVSLLLGSSSSSSSSSSSNANDKIKGGNKDSLLNKKRRVGRKHRVATVDRQRLITCVRSVGAVSTYGPLLSSMLDITMLEDVASTTRKMNGDEIEMEAQDAAQLLHLDSEMRELGGVAASSPRGSLISGTNETSTSDTPQLLSLEELESSIGMDLDVVEEEEVEEEEEEVETAAADVRNHQQEGSKQEEEDWVLCQSWISCPIGHYLGKSNTLY